ncbi:MAG TPA: proline--tRNA ligase [bacterium]|nr:proline--tRNA ligase [bacterium]
MVEHEDKKYVKEICRQDVDFSQWYIDVVRKAELADYAPVRGCMVIRPYGFAIWELLQAALDADIKAAGHENAYFPLLIPESFLAKEAAHTEGFTPQVAWVTHGGNEELEERLAIRPTSEAIICQMYAKWIRSWRDLPVMINQWANIIRWEKVTRLFLRTTEFLWQEGHTAHRTPEEAQEEALKILELYENFSREILAIPVYTGVKTDRERFPGAVQTYTVEAMMPDGRALQAGTSHDLGQHFAKVFDITYLEEDNQLHYVWQTSWGVTTRLIGALIMVHGDDAGLKLPPRLAPVQTVVVPITFEETKEEVLAQARTLADELERGGIRVKLDDRDEYKPGWKFNEWELRGAPLRLELGPKDMARGVVTAVRRDTRDRAAVPRGEIVAWAKDMLDVIQKDMLAAATVRRDAKTQTVESRDDFYLLFEGRPGFVRAPWCGDGECEGRIAEETGATIRFLPLEAEEASGAVCVGCGGEAGVWAYFAKAY